MADTRITPLSPRPKLVSSSGQIKLSQIAPAAAPPASTDQIVGVTAGPTDVLFSVAQLGTAVTPPVFGASGPAHSVGIVPDPGGIAGTTHFLREDGTWVVPAAVTPPVFGASGPAHSVGIVPDPGSAAGTTRFLREDATFATPPVVTPPVFGGSGPAHSVGIVPDPGSAAGTTRFLREDATFATPAAVTPPVFGASGPAHSVGIVPDPGSTAATTHFLREDATWVVPAYPAGPFFINAAAEFNVSTTGDQTSNINNALATASTISGRGTVVVPSGTLTISSALAVPPGIRLVGQGMSATILQGAMANNGSFVVLNGSFSELCDIGINALAGGTNVAAVNISNNGTTEAMVDRVNIEGNNHLQWGVRVAGASGGYFNRVTRSRLNNCFFGVEMLGTNALEMLLSDLNIGSSTGGCSQGIRSTVNSGYFSMVKVETNSCTDCGLFTQDCNYEAVDCLMDNSGNFGWFSDFSTTTGMPVTGWYLRLVNCRGSATLNTGGNNHGLASNGMGFHMGNSGAGAGSILNLNMAGCGSYANAVFGFNVTAPSTPANTRAMISGCGSFLDAVAANGDGMYFNFCHLAVSGCGAFNAGNGVHTADGIMIDTGCTGRVTGCIGSGNTSQNVNITAASAVLGQNNESTNTRTVAQLPSAAAAGVNGVAYVTDATVTTFATVVAGGGVNTVPVYSDGTSWRIG